MVCNNCGTQLNDDATFCPNCGTPQTPVQSYGAPAVNPQQANDAKQIMIFGIVAIATAWFIGVPGLIFGIITNNKVKAYEAAYGPITGGQAKVGKILGLVGMILGIVCTACYVIGIACAGCMACAAANSSYGSSYYY